MKHHETTFELLSYLRQLKEKNEIQDFKAVSNDSSTLAIWIKGGNQELKDEIYKDYSPFVANVLLEEDDEKSELDKDYISLIQELCEEKDFVHNNSHYREWREDFKDLEKSFSELKANTIAGYSFKGGMGRSASLAYLAVYFASRGKKVVVIDFDFEAPGISNLLLDKITQFGCFGVLNYLLDKPLLEEDVPIDRYGAKAKIENLIVVPSGINSHYKDEVDYFDLLQKINFNSRYYAKTVFSLIEDLQNHYKPDLIFIDTRAGLSESNGTLLRFSKMSLLFFSSEKQSQDGFKLIASRLSAKRQLKDLDRKRFRLINSTIRFDGTPEIRRKKEEFEDFIKGIFGDSFYISHLERNRKMLDASLTDLYDLAQGQEELLPQITDIIETKLLGKKENILQKIELYNKKFHLAAQNGDYNTAIRHSRNALELVEFLSSKESKRNEAMIVSNLGNAYVRLNQPQEAKNYYELALELSKKIEDKELEARTLGNLGNLFFHQKQFKEATDYYELTLNIAKEIRNKELERESLASLANVYFELNQFQKAKDYYELALEIAKEIEDKELEGLSLTKLGIAYEQLGKLEKAKACFREAFDILDKIDSKDEEFLKLLLKEIETI